MISTPKVTVNTSFIPSSDPSSPALVLRVTRLVDSYMIWVGNSETAIEDVDQAASQGSLCRDWACAMPVKVAGMPAAATCIFRSSSSDNALSMAQRLAKRFGKQILLSVDISMGGPAVLQAAERGIVEALRRE